MSEDVKDSKTKIILCAAKLFAKLGLDKCSTRDIAKESDANISLISYYFGGKEGLYKEVMRNFAEEVKSSAQKIIDVTEKSNPTRQTFEAEMKMVLNHIINIRMKYPEMAKIFAREKLSGLVHSQEVHKEVFYPLTQNFFEIFRRAQNAGIVKSEVHPAVFFLVMSEGIWGFFQMLECETPLRGDCGHLIGDREALQNQFFEIYFKGVLL